MKRTCALISALVMALLLFGPMTALGADVPKAPSKVKAGKMAPKVPNVKSAASKGSSQTSSENKGGNSNSNYGKKVEKKEGNNKK